MAGVGGKMVCEMEIRCDADAFYDLFRKRPYDLPTTTPLNIPSGELLEGEWGTVGSIVSWNYFHEGRNILAIKKTEDIDSEKKSMRTRVIKGDLMEQFKSFTKTMRVQTNMVTWTFEYEKKVESVPDPDTFMDFTRKITEDIDTKLALK